MLFNTKNGLLMAFFLCISTGCVSISEDQQPKIPQDDLRVLDIHKYKLRLTAAPKSHNVTATIPYLVWFADEQHIDINIRYLNGEMPTSAEITIIRHGLKDDSIANIKYIFTMTKTVDSWTVANAQQGFLCRRGDNPAYQASFCN